VWTLPYLCYNEGGAWRWGYDKAGGCFADVVLHSSKVTTRCMLCP